jgi:hypothetical protein
VFATLSIIVTLCGRRRAAARRWRWMGCST